LRFDCSVSLYFAPKPPEQSQESLDSGASCVSGIAARGEYIFFFFFVPSYVHLVVPSSPFLFMSRPFHIGYAPKDLERPPHPPPASIDDDPLI
jgi:hypothetical protein